jgi:hypothetical protein
MVAGSASGKRGALGVLGARTGSAAETSGHLRPKVAFMLWGAMRRTSPGGIVHRTLRLFPASHYRVSRAAAFGQVNSEEVRFSGHNDCP